MKVISDKKERVTVIEFNEIELQALANFIGPTSLDDREKRWKMTKKENESLSELYSLLSDMGIESKILSIYPFEGS